MDRGRTYHVLGLLYWSVLFEIMDRNFIFSLFVTRLKKAKSVMCLGLFDV